MEVLSRHIIDSVIQLSNRKMLNNMMIQLQRDQIYLHAILSGVMTESLRELVTYYLKECMSMEADAANIASSRCWVIHDLQADTKLTISTITKLRVSRLHCDLDIASDIIIQNTKSMIQALVKRHHTSVTDMRIHTLFQRYVDCQIDMVQWLKNFLCGALTDG